MKVEEEKRQATMVEYRRHEKDTGSAEVQVALITARIEHLMEHLKSHKKDHASRRGLLMMVGHRAQLLKHLSAASPDRYKTVIERLGLRR
jgi:small subunit ribosomal protein S15